MTTRTLAWTASCSQEEKGKVNEEKTSPEESNDRICREKTQVEEDRDECAIPVQASRQLTPRRTVPPNPFRSAICSLSAGKSNSHL